MTMTQPIDSTGTDLFPRIVDVLERGGRLTSAILDYIAASLFPPEPDRLADFLINHAADSEWDSLLDLIFYPDPSIQIDLELLLEMAAYTVDDEKDVHNRLLDRPIDARISMPDGSALTSIQLPDFVKSQYLERLNISWQMDPLVLTAIQNGVTAVSAPVVKVRLRNARIRLTPARQHFLCRFFERMADSDPDFLACLDLMLALLDNTVETVDIYDQLVAHKRSLFRSLQQARRFETLLRQSNMETLMLQGVRAPHAPRDELLRHMRLIDLICVGLFGKTEAIAAPTDQPLRRVSDPDSLDATVRLFLGES